MVNIVILIGITATWLPVCISESLTNILVLVVFIAINIIPVFGTTATWLPVEQLRIFAVSAVFVVFIA